MADQPRDHFDTYFAEKIWEMIPEIYRHEDGLAEKPGTLRAIVEIIAEQAAILRRSNDRLWEDQFIEFCDDWVISYLGELVAARLPAVLTSRGRRTVVGKAIYYRRRKGTLALFEQFISDIASWDGTVVEQFRRLGRTWHSLDPLPEMRVGRLSGTPSGGWADLRHTHAAELAGGPFDEYSHTPDFRRPRGVDGRYGISKLAFYLYRLSAFPLEGVTPSARPDGMSFSFDPSGRDIALFQPRARSAHSDSYRAAREWELPAPIACRVLGHAEYVVSEADVLALIADFGLSQAAADDLRRLRGQRFPSEPRFRITLESLPNAVALLVPAVYAGLLARALQDDCGKKALLATDPLALRVEEAPGMDVSPELIVAGDLTNWSATAPDKSLVIDPERGRFLFLNLPPAADTVADYYYGFSGEIGAGTYDRREVEDLIATTTPLQGGGAVGSPSLPNDGIARIEDSATYGPLPNKLNIVDLVCYAANQQRPYLRLESNWVLNTGANEDSNILLDGLWIGGAGAFSLILRGDYEQVTIRSTTLDPGGVDRDGNPIDPVPLVIQGHIETLVIIGSITGPIMTQGSGVVEKLIIEDAIVQSLDPLTPALQLDEGEVELRRVTIFGSVDIHRLCYASEALITGAVDVTDTQNGCFRFSVAPEGSRVPAPYESHFYVGFGHFFTSRTFGHPGYAQLSATAPAEILYGAENGSEIGAFSSLLNPNKLFGLQAVVEEYLPFGLLPFYIQKT